MRVRLRYFNVIGCYKKRLFQSAQVHVGKLIEVVVTSLRVDRILATGIGLGRRKAEYSLLRGCVKLNGETVTKKSTEVKIGDVIDRIDPDQSTGTDYLLWRLRFQEIEEETTKKGSLRVRLLRTKALRIDKEAYKSSL